MATTLSNSLIILTIIIMTITSNDPDERSERRRNQHRQRLQNHEKLRLIPGHCDPTCNIHDWYVGVRGDKVETLWPVSARGKAY
jgi:D-serine deaminase-like pyridoxal phosphate-dependent protein